MASPTAAAANKEVVVVGAGIVGVCCALYLQRDGHRITLIDRGGPAAGASAGNAGSLGVASVPPTSMPGVFKKVPRMLIDPMQPLAVRWRHFPRALPWFVRFLLNSRRQAVERIADHRAALLARIIPAYEPLLKEAGAEYLVRKLGRLFAYESEDGLARSRYALEMRRRRGITVQELTGEEARVLEPALGPRVKCAAYFPDVRSVANPQRLVEMLAEAAVRNGATLLRETARAFEFGPEGARAVITEAGVRPFERCVIAMGAWSGALTRTLGYDPPLEAERGYHAMIPDPGVEVKVPLMLADRNVAITPMEGGLRISGIAEFAGLDAPAEYGRVDALLRNARAVIPGLKTEAASRWMGPRPSMPDSTPVIGPAPRHGNVYFAFGHDHIGLALGAITGKLIAELMAGRPTSVDVRPYRPDRFGGTLG